ncbi:MAG: elongation factor G [bacterium]|nr:elongation factor G [bacterium]
MIQVTKNRLYSFEKIRNIGIIAHIDAGKTTTTERILFESGRTYKVGSVDDGTTVTDWLPQERERGITIVSATTTTFWTPKIKGDIPQESHRINIIDTPGHIDFTIEVERSLRVLDGAVMVFDGRTGVESQSETVWRQADRYNVPRICSLNKLNLVGADFESSLSSIRERLNHNASFVDIPIGLEQELRGVVDLIEMKAYTYKNVQDTALTEEEIPTNLLPLAKKYRHELIEMVAEYDDKLLEKYLETGELLPAEIKRAIRKGVIAGKFFPILGGDNRTCLVQRLLDAIIEYLPSPIDIPPAKGVNPESGAEEIREPKIEAPFAGLAFKVQLDPHVGKLYYVRIYSGKLKSGSYVYNPAKGAQERISRLLLLHANQREEIEEAYAGEIVAVIGLKSTSTGDTLCDRESPVVLEKIIFPEPVISLAIEPKTKADQEKLAYALQCVTEEDPSFKVKTNRETGQTVISGMGELHLEVWVDRMKREMGVLANVGAPQVAYKETIKKEAEGEGKYIRQTGGHGQYGHAVIEIKPKPRGEGWTFVNAIKGGAIPADFIPSIEKGAREASANGVLAGYPITDIEITLNDGSFHEVDSSDIAFQIAGSLALQAAVKKADLTILEPIMKTEVTTPEEFMGDVIGDLSKRRGQILGTERRGKAVVILAMVPLAELSGYATTLRSMSQGRASYYMEPSHYDEVPRNVQEQIILKTKKV